ncbi:hypothetical protein [Phenylobacterium sp.]|uniref:hypothetical protein n=1 Tax=Phenylobacterium sp. TaxID=1871053 RepID=UPI00263898ED|nr:hypothetical protein [Phenylobacterium sp.]
MRLLEKTERLFQCAAIENVLRREHSWHFEFSSASLSVEHLWRVLADGAPVLTDREDGLTYGGPVAIDAQDEARRLLLGLRVLGAIVDPETADLRISFDGGLRLDVLTIAPRTVAWEVSGPKFCIAARGGRLSEPFWFLASAPEA